MPTPWPDPRFRHLSAALLASLSADEIGDAVIQHVQLRAGREGADKEDLLPFLAPGVRAVYTTWLVDADVLNGGFNQYFYNPWGAQAGEALAGYELLGAEDYAAVMRAAIAMRELERERMAPFYEASSLEAFSESYNHTGLFEIDQRYDALGDRIHSVWAEVARTRPELFDDRS